MFEMSELETGTEGQAGAEDWGEAWGDEWWGCQETWVDAWPGEWSQTAVEPEQAENVQLSSLMLSSLVCSAKRQIDREACGPVLPRLELDFHDFSVAVGDSHTRDSSFVEPLFLQELQTLKGDAEWWLLDSGASVTVLIDHNAAHYGVDLSSVQVAGETEDRQYAAANGSPVTMVGRCRVDVVLALTCQHDGRKMVQASMSALIGSTKHNILSVTHLVWKGWTFQQSSRGISLISPEGDIATEVNIFADVPWVRLRSLTGFSGHNSEVSVRGPPQDEHLLSISRGVCIVASKTTEAELAKHRMQGHTPFHPACRHCQKARSVYQHRRRVRGRLESEIFADFFCPPRVRAELMLQRRATVFLCLRNA